MNIKKHSVGPWAPDLDALNIGNKETTILECPLDDKKLTIAQAKAIIKLAAEAPILRDIAKTFLDYLEIRGEPMDTVMVNHIKHTLKRTEI